MFTFLKRSLRKAVRRHAMRHSYGSALLASEARWYLAAYDNQSFDMNENGELGVLQRIGALSPGVIFDVGANHGDWTAAARHCCQTAHIHAFEISPPTANALRERFKSDAVTVNDFGLGDSNAEVQVRHYDSNDLITTLLPMPGIHSAPSTMMTGVLRTCESYCAERGITRIDFLKIDTEGAEPQVLAGCGRMLDDGRISAIQFEYGMANIYSKFLLKDFYELLEPKGYIIGPITPRGVKFRSYDPRHEKFELVNFIAVRSALNWTAALSIPL